METVGHLVLASTTASSKELGVIFLADKYRVGADIKFKKNARVFVISKQIPEKEELQQMLGRGSRANGDYIGNLYT